MFHEELGSELHCICLVVDICEIFPASRTAEWKEGLRK